MKTTTRFTLPFATVLTLAAGQANAQQWTVTPYVWTAGLTAKVSHNGTQVVNEHIGFSELIEDVDMAAMGRVEGRFGRYGAMLDVFYIAMSTAGDAVQLPNGASGSLNTEMGMTVADATASYIVMASRKQNLALVAGMRVLVESSQLDLTVPTSPTTAITESTSSSDFRPNAIVGLRFRRRFTPHLSIDARGDVGTGDIKLTWSAGSEMSYGFGASQRVALSAGYRQLVIEYREESSVQTDLKMSGFVTGVRIGF